MHVLDGLYYTSEHEWVRLEEGDEATIGITEFAQDQLGDVVFVQLPAIGASLLAGEPFGEVESVKTVSELYAPVTGVVLAVNDTLADRPELVNEQPYEGGWMIRVRVGDRGELNTLMDATGYRTHISG